MQNYDIIHIDIYNCKIYIFKINDFIIHYQIEGIFLTWKKEARYEGTSAKNVKTLRTLARERA